MWRITFISALVVQMILGFTGCDPASPAIVTQEQGCSSRVRWVTQVGGGGTDVVRSVAALPPGAVATAGSFSATATILAGHPLVSAGASDIVVVRYSAADGHPRWVARAGGPGDDHAAALAFLPDGSLVVVGAFESTAVFGDTQPNRTVLRSAGATDVFVARYGPTGQLLWARRAGGPDRDEPFAVSVHPGGGVVVVGRVGTEAAFGPGEPNETQLEAVSGEDAFLARFDLSGALTWVRSSGTQSLCAARGVAVSPSGAIYTVGEIGKGGAGTAESARDLFVSRFNAQGISEWLVRSTGSGVACAESVVALADESVVVAGAFDGSITLGAGGESPAQLTSAGMRDGLTLRLDSDGKLFAARRYGGPGDDVIRAVALGEAGVLVTGEFSSSVRFGSESSDDLFVYSAGGSDVFVALLDTGLRPIWVRRGGGKQHDAARGIAVLPWGHSLLAGSFEGEATFGSPGAGVTTLQSAGDTDGFVLMLGP